MSDDLLSIEQLIQIFYSNGNERRADREILNEILFLITEGLLFFHQESLCPIETYHSYIDRLYSGEIENFSIAGGSNGHLALKLIALDMLVQKNWPRGLVEREYEGYRPDIITQDLELIVECGTVNPSKIFSYFRSSHIKRVVIIPYPSEGDLSISKVDLTPAKELANFISRLEMDRFEKIKKLLRR